MNQMSAIRDGTMGDRTTRIIRSGRLSLHPSGGQQVALCLTFSLLVVIFTGSHAVSQPMDDPLTLDSTSFQLLRGERGYLLSHLEGEPFPIPRDWLEPDAEGEGGVDEYVSSFNYDSLVTAFNIGGDLTGLHISSYDIQKEGSAQAAAGRDVFLVWDRKKRTLSDAELAPGITKERIRSGGCPFARFLGFIIGDIDKDRLTDIGIIREEISCELEYDEEREVETLAGPFYEKWPVRWYVFVNDRWDYRQDYDGRFPSQGYRDLPLIGLAKSPVDVIRDRYPGIRQNRSGARE